MARVKSGWLTKRGSFPKNWKHRYIILTPTGIMYFKKPTAKKASGTLKFSDQTEVKALQQSTKGTPEGFGWTVREEPESREYIFVADTTASRDEWLEATTQVLEKVKARGAAAVAPDEEEGDMASKPDLLSEKQPEVLKSGVLTAGVADEEEAAGDEHMGQQEEAGEQVEEQSDEEPAQPAQVKEQPVKEAAAAEEQKEETATQKSDPGTAEAEPESVEAEAAEPESVEAEAAEPESVEAEAPVDEESVEVPSRATEPTPEPSKTPHEVGADQVETQSGSAEGKEMSTVESEAVSDNGESEVALASHATGSESEQDAEKIE